MFLAFCLFKAEELISDAVLVTFELGFTNESADDRLPAPRLSEVSVDWRSHGFLTAVFHRFHNSARLMLQQCVCVWK